MRSRPRLLMTTAFCLLGGSSTFGSTYAASNLETPRTEACQAYVLTDETLLAGSFRTGDFFGGYQFQGAVLSIASVEVDTSSTEPTGVFSVGIWKSNDAGVLSDFITSLSPVEAFPGNGSTPIPGLHNFRPINDIYLEPSSVYWIGAAIREGNGLRVGIERTGSKLESEYYPGWSIGDQSYVFENRRPRLESGCVPYLAVTIWVPEPATTTLALLGGCLIFGTVRRSKP